MPAGALPERVRELGEWLAAEGELGLTRTLTCGLARWDGVDVALPSIREYEEVSAVLRRRSIAGERNPGARPQTAEGSVAPFGGAALRCGGACRSDGRGPTRRSGGVDRRLRHDRRLPRPRGPRRLVAPPCGASRESAG